MSLFYRLWLALASTFGLLILALGMGEYQTLKRALASEVDRNLEQRAHWVETQLRSGRVPGGLMVPGHQTLEELGKLFIEIYSADGRLLNRSSNLEGNSLPGEPSSGTHFSTVVTPESHPFRIYQLVTASGHQIRVGESLELASRSLSSSLVKLFLLGLGGLGVAAWVSHRLLWQFCSPLSQLADKAAEIAQGGNVRDRLPVAPSMVSEVRVVSETINQLLARVEQLLLAQSQLLQDTSHELRNPLSVLQMDLDLLLRDDLAPDIRAEIGEEFGGELQRLIRLVGDLLDLSWAETETRVELQNFALLPLAQRIVGGYAGRAAGRRLELLGECAEVQADERRVEQILRNLLDNSFRYAGERASIRLRLYPEMPPAAQSGAATGATHCLLVLEDDGEGIPREHREKVFERFYRLEADRSRQKGGSGLGLPVARALARAMGGDLWVGEGEFKGVAFYLALRRSTRPLQT